MASGSQNLTSDKARILSTTPGSAYFWRGDNTWSNILTNTLYLNSTVDASGTADNRPALIIGTFDGTHLEFDGNEIMTKTDGTTPSTLYINYEGGLTHCGGMLQATALGITNTDSTSGDGISLYNGAMSGQPTYGIMFAGTGTFGTHGQLTGNWATYFTMNDQTNRGWIFRRGTTNVASINGSGTMTIDGKLFISQPSTNRDNGIIGSYDYTKAAAIWSMGKSYQIAADGSGFGNLYGAAYGYGGQTYLSSKSYAGGHQFLWCQAGTIYCALGNNIWTEGKVTLNGNVLEIFGSGSDQYINFYGSRNSGGTLYAKGQLDFCETRAAFFVNTQYANNSTSWSEFMSVTYSNAKVGIGTTSPSEKLSVNGWVGTIGATGWYNITYAGGWYMADATWIRSYNSKPLYIDIGSNNAYGLGGHRLAVGISGSSHSSIMMRGGSIMYGFCVNNNGNWYFGNRTSNSMSSTSGDTYRLYGNTTAFYPYNDNSVNLGSTSKRWAQCVATTIYAYGGYLQSTKNSNTVTIGSQNTSYCHITNSASIPFWFNNSVNVQGHVYPYGNNTYSCGTSSYKWASVYATNFYGTLSGSATGIYTTSANGSNIDALKSVWNNLPTNQTLGVYIAHGSASFFFGWRLAGYAVGSAYGGGIIDNYGNPDYVNISAGTFTAKHIWLKGDSVTSAVWNDYAEHRECDLLPPGSCVQENDNGHLTIADRRLIPGASIISDTWGFSQGETEKAKTPIAISGRVLAYTYLPREMYHAGQAVCSAPGGTIDIMTREEIQKYPDAIIGIVSEIPDYKEWGGGKNADRSSVKVNNRIWIKVR